jgi:undecaprenyl-diphosphatase
MDVDLRVLEWLRAHATPAGYTIFNVITQLGSAGTMWAVGLAVAVVLAVRRQRIVLVGWVAALGGGGLLNALLKHVIQRPRPPYATAFIHDASWSFPSGHAMASLIGYGMLAYVLVTLWVHRRSWQVSIVVAATLLVVSIGFSRLYLGVHYFSDVVGGYAAGALWFAACIAGVQITRRRGEAI